MRRDDWRKPVKVAFMQFCYAQRPIAARPWIAIVHPGAPCLKIFAWRAITVQIHMEVYDELPVVTKPHAASKAAVQPKPG